MRSVQENWIERKKIQAENSMFCLVIPDVVPKLRRDSSPEEIRGLFLSAFRKRAPRAGRPQEDITERIVQKLSSSLPDRTIITSEPAPAVSDFQLRRTRDGRVHLSFSIDADPGSWRTIAWEIWGDTGLVRDGTFPATRTDFRSSVEALVPATVHFSLWAERPGPGGRGTDHSKTTTLTDVLSG